MLTRLPEFIDPILLADRNARIEGELPLGGFERLASALFNDIGNVEINLIFGREGRVPTIEGHVSTVLVLKCQRCLESVGWTISHDFKLGVVTSYVQVDKLPNDCEPLLLIEEDKVPLKSVIEDELLLCLPDIPKHEDNCATPVSSENTLGSAIKPERTTKENPFSILADLKNQKKLET